MEENVNAPRYRSLAVNGAPVIFFIGEKRGAPRALSGIFGPPSVGAGLVRSVGMRARALKGDIRLVGGLQGGDFIGSRAVNGDCSGSRAVNGDCSGSRAVNGACSGSRAVNGDCSGSRAVSGGPILIGFFGIFIGLHDDPRDGGL